MSCNYCWNQPKKYGRYDLYLDGKIKADDFVYRTKDAESGEIIATTLSEKIDEIEDRLATHFTFNTDYATITDLESAFNNGELKDTVIYIVKNETVSDNPDSRDSYNEYMVVTVKDEEGNETKTLELIGSGSYAKQQADLNKEIADREEADKNISETVASITGYSFEKISDENSATNIDNRIKTEIKRAKGEEERIEKELNQEVELRTSQIKGINQEAKKNREKIEQLESTVSTEITRATKAEDELSARIETIEGYEIDSRVKQLEINLPAEKERATEKENEIVTKLTTITGYAYDVVDDVTTKGGNINTRIVNEIKDREKADKLIRETVASITGYPFEKVGKITSNFGHDEQGKNNWGDAKGFDTVITDSGKLDEIDVYCRYSNTVDNKTTCIKLWKITFEQEDKNLIQYLGTSDNYQTHDTVGKKLKYTFYDSDINVTTGDKIRVTFHNESQNDVSSYDQSTCTGTCIQINTIQPSSDFVIITNNGGFQNYVAKHSVHVVTEGKSLLETTEESMSISTENTKQIESLIDTIAELRKNIVVLELDKGYQITTPTIETSYEEGSLNDVILGDLTVTSENLQIGSNEVNVKITNISIGDKSYSLNVDSTCEIIIGELGDIQDGASLVIPVEITDTDATTVASGTINVSITGTHKKQTVTLHYNLLLN